MQLKDIKILVVDDHAMTRDLVRTVLRYFGFSAMTAERGKDGLRILRNQKIHMVLCDWNMPDMAGIDVLREVRKSELLRKIPFLMITAESTPERVQTAITEGANDYITKPFSAEVIGEKMRKALDSLYPGAARLMATR